MQNPARKSNFKVSTRWGSLRFGIPVFGKANPRDTLDRWAAAKGEEGLENYRRTKNAKSIDGLPAVDDD